MAFCMRTTVTLTPQEKREDEIINKLISIARGEVKSQILGWYYSGITRASVISRVENIYPNLMRKVR